MHRLAPTLLAALHRSTAAGVLRRLAALLAMVLLLASCQVDVEVDVLVTDDGSGTLAVAVTLDAAAVDAVGPIEPQLRTADLVNAGWKFDELVLGEDGSQTLRTTKKVGSADEWQSALDEIAGSRVFREVSVTSDSKFAEQRRRMSYFVDLSRGVSVLSDPDATALLNGEPLGADLDVWTQGRPIDDAVSITIRTSVSSDDGSSPVAQVVTPRFDEPQPIPVAVQSTTESTLAIILRWVAIALGALAALSGALAVTGLILERRSDRLRRSTRFTQTPGIPSDRMPAQARANIEARSKDSGVRLVVLDPLTVLYQQGDLPEVYLLPFIRHNGGKRRADEIMDAYQLVMLGKMNSADFWTLCGVAGEPEVVDEIFTQMRWLRPGADAFLTEMQRRRIPVAAISNDANVWSQWPRDRDRLSHVWPWLVSAEVGVMKPHLGIFEMLRRETGIAYEHCLYIDTDIDSLDTAKTLGMKTTFFDSGEDALPAAVGHARVEDFSGFFRRRL